MSQVGREFGTVTGRKRRCGWFDAAALRRSGRINGFTGLCITKLDVLDGLEELNICTGYKLDGEFIDLLPIGADEVARCEPVTETMPGWKETTFGVKRWEDLPANARAYLDRLEALCEVPIAIVSTGPERDETILKAAPVAVGMAARGLPATAPVRDDWSAAGPAFGPAQHFAGQGSELLGNLVAHAADAETARIPAAGDHLDAVGQAGSLRLPPRRAFRSPCAWRFRKAPGEQQQAFLGMQLDPPSDSKAKVKMP